MENFTFLKNDYPDLYLLCSDVAKYIETDNSISMLKARQAIEFIVKYLGAETDDLFVNINNLEDKNIANSRIIELFHFIRKKANKSVHNAINADTEGVLDALIEICVWLALGHDKKNISIIKFTDKEKFFLKKYGDYKVSNSEENFEAVDTINPLEVVGKFSIEDVETVDVLEQDVFETYEEYCGRIESLPAIKICYACLDPSQIDDYCDIAFPLFHVSKNSKIESASIAAFYASDVKKNKNIDGIIKAKLKIYEEKIHYDYNTLTLQDDDEEIKLYAISLDKFGYENEEQFENRIKKYPLLPVGIAKPIRKEYDLKRQILPFESIPLAYVSKVFSQRKINCSLNRDDAKILCLVKSNFKIYANFMGLDKLYNFNIVNQECNTVLVYNDEKTIKKSFAEAKYDKVLNDATRGNVDAQIELAELYDNGLGVIKSAQTAVEWYKRAAEQGNTMAQFEMAEHYINGNGIKKDEKKAVEWYKRAAEQGCARAQFEMAERYNTGNGIEKDEKKSLKWYKRAAEQGNTEAQFRLAVCYEKGEGVKKNENSAYKLCKKAAEQGNAEAQYKLAEYYAFGVGIKKNKDSAFEWYKRAAEQGNVEAQRKLAECYECGNGTEENEQKAFKWYKKAAEQGNMNAQFDLAVCYEEGIGTEINEAKAFKWYKKAAEQGEGAAQYEIAKCYELGRGTEKDEQKAFQWYKNSAEQGEEDAQYELAECYAKGVVVGVDEKEAFKWYSKAAEQGNVDAQYKLALCYECGKGTERDEQKAFERYEELAERRNVDAQYRLAKCYECGKGTEKDEQKAFEWYKAAAERGNLDAFLSLAVYYETGKGTAQEKQKAFEFYKEFAEQGNVDAQYKLAKCYAVGIGTDKYAQRAFGWYRRAAEQGYAKAQYELAECYANGIGIGKDKQKALEWYKKATENGERRAEKKLAHYFKEKEIEKEDINNFSAKKLYHLGWCYEHGDGVDEDKEYAKILYAKAAEKGNFLAGGRLHYLNSLD